jgi:hypothetical protein
MGGAKTISYRDFVKRGTIIIPGKFVTHLHIQNAPLRGAVMSERSDADCAFQMHNGVKNKRRFILQHCKPLKNKNGTFYIIAGIND